MESCNDEFQRKRSFFLLSSKAGTGLILDPCKIAKLYLAGGSKGFGDSQLEGCIQSSL